jgi:flagellar hook assembly protein FlgD
MVREVGPGSGQGPWPAYRHDATRIARASTSSSEIGNVTGSGLLADVFVMPNPVVRRQTAGFHYQVRRSSASNTEVNVTIRIFTASGQLVRTISGSISPTTDNLVFWDLTNEQGDNVAPGLYLARIQAELGTQVDAQVRNFVVVR